ncbi:MULTISPECIES: outer membrane lipoprotein carrier protein LolA [unclassified Cobetia]|uniref:LolA family protein n=1 Tax=unclassified Cobetia TaxID=2609414 RepID=UPI0020986351|nr:MULTISPECIES: outer membrane lipoprotein carrier protein LolA [unclassified Cobetia]MCO7231353.1 outer membrane lipoprotein carrier protein LolA [Cobetia sp. Dlab-2-AX]MCO7234238.1 outer membrane lipoprotein carrier protein LolA [Cobetia sp. Dlab-2-U]
MTSRLAIVATALLIGATSLAQAAEFDTRALTQQLARTAPACGDFQQTRWLEDVGAELESRGHFRLIGDPNAPEGLVWETTSPIEDRLEMRPDASQGPNGEPLPADQQAMAELLISFFHGDWQALEEHFSLTLMGTPDDWQASLTPNDARLAEAIERLEIDGGSWLEHVNLASGDGDRLELTLTADGHCER